MPQPDDPKQPQEDPDELMPPTMSFPDVPKIESGGLEADADLMMSAPDLGPTGPNPLTPTIEGEIVEGPDGAGPLTPTMEDLGGGVKASVPGPASVPHPALRAVSGRAPRYGAPTPLAQGGMGEIKLLEDKGLQRTVVLKNLHPHLLEHADSVGRFIEEAQITAQLEHPNIVPVHDLGLDAKGEAYFTMKHVTGMTLAEYLQRCRKDPKNPEHTVLRRLDVFRATCQGVSFAHSRGVIHRDLKPANVMIGEFGEVLVMDWGLAKYVSNQPIPATRRIENVDRTVAGQVMGTPRYLAPEQARGEVDRVAQPTDIYALGIILLEMMTLRRGFSGKAVASLLVKASEGSYDPPGAFKDDPHVPPELVGIINKALALRIRDRYRSVKELIADLDAFREGRAVSAHSDGPLTALVKWGKRNMAVSAAALALIFGLAITDAVRVFQKRHATETAIQAAEAKIESGDPARWLEAKQELEEILEAEPNHGVAYSTRQAAMDRLATRAVQASERAEGLELTAESTAEQRSAWFQAQAEALHAARAHLRLDPESSIARGVRARHARAMARELGREGSITMAELMLTEAAEAGLAPELIEAVRAEFTGADPELEAALQGYLAGPSRGPVFEAGLARLARGSSPYLHGRLISGVLGRPAREAELAARALAAMEAGDARATVSSADLPAPGLRAHDVVERLRCDLVRWARARARRVGKRLEISARQAIALRLLGEMQPGQLDGDRQSAHVGLIKVLMRLGGQEAAAASGCALIYHGSASELWSIRLPISEAFSKVEIARDRPSKDVLPVQTRAALLSYALRRPESLEAFAAIPTTQMTHQLSVMRARALLEQGETQLAKQVAGAIPLGSLDGPQRMAIEARVAERGRQNKRADALSHVAWLRDPNNPELRMQVVERSLAAGKYDRVEEYTTVGVLESEGHAARLRLLRGRARIADGKVESGLADLMTAAMLLPWDPEPRRRLALALAERGDHHAAREVLRQAQELEPASIELIEAEARLGVERGSPDHALMRVVELAIQRTPDKQMQQRLQRARAEMRVLVRQQVAHGVALDRGLRELAQLEPTPEVRLLRSRWLWQRGRAAEAEQVLAGNDAPSFVIQRARIQAGRGDLAEAERALRELAEKHRNHAARAREQLARSYLEARQFDKAKAQAELALEQDRGLYQARYVLAIVAATQGDAAAAARHYAELLSDMRFAPRGRSGFHMRAARYAAQARDIPLMQKHMTLAIRGAGLAPRIERARAIANTPMREMAKHELQALYRLKLNNGRTEMVKRVYQELFGRPIEGDLE